MSNSNDEVSGYEVVLDEDLEPEEQVGNAVEVDEDPTLLAEGSFGVDRLNNAPQVYQVIENNRQSIHLLLIKRGNKYYLEEMTEEASADTYKDGGSF